MAVQSSNSSRKGSARSVGSVVVVAVVHTKLEPR